MPLQPQPPLEQHLHGQGPPHFVWGEASYTGQPHLAQPGSMPWNNEPLPTLLTAQQSQHYAPAAMKPVLQLDKILLPVSSSQPEAAPRMLGSPEMPTLGSAGHGLGECKPCAFFWKAQGCGNGVQCSFCHLCDSGEKKRRAKDKRVAMRMARNGGLLM